MVVLYTTATDQVKFLSRKAFLPTTGLITATVVLFGAQGTSASRITPISITTGLISMVVLYMPEATVLI